MEGQRADDDLARLLGVDREALVAALGTGWRSDVSLAEPSDEQWFVQGRPVQVAVDLGRRRHPARSTQAADDIAARRRRTFRWCRTCRELDAPEHFLRDYGYCMSCASGHHGVVF